jgi:16S rRNA (guanine527-N7)-methyltransferase
MSANMKSDEANLIKTWCEQNKLNLDEIQIEQMLKYLDIIREMSKKMNLVSRNDIESLVDRHLLDSLHALIAYEFPQNAIVADLGSGAGFPGIPITVARPDLSMNLIESRRLKCLFLENVVQELGLKTAKVNHSRWEKTTGKFDVILSRAVYAEPELKNMTLPRLAPGGALLYFEKFMKIKIIRE